MTDVEALDELNKVCARGVGCSVVRCRTMAALKIAVRALSEKVAREEEDDDEFADEERPEDYGPEADDMERERRYEYSQRRYDLRLGIDVVDMLHCSSAEGVKNLHCRFIENGTIVRREVGEWEEVYGEE